MEGRTELDEIEKLLGEIPNATSGHQHFEEFGQCNSDLKRQSLGGSFPIEPSIPVLNKSIESEEPSLPDDQLWISAFAELSFKDGVRMEAVCSPLVNYKALPNQTILFQGQCPNSLKRTSSNLDPQVMVVPSSQSPNPPSSGFNNFDVKNNSQESSNLLKLNVPELKKQQFGNYPPIEKFSNTEPLPHGVREKEHYHKLHQQYRYQVQNMGRGAQHPIQANGNVATRLVNFNAIHVLDKVGKMTIPEKILTRSNGLNSLRTIKFGSIRENEAGTHVNQNGRVIPNGHFRQRLSSPTAGHLQLDSLCTWSLSTDTAHLKTNILRPQPQKYNSVDEVVGRIYHMSKDQNGCRFLQRKFTDGSPEDVQKIFLEIIDHIVELMTDPFGNYLVQKLLEVCTEDQQMQILHAITRRAGDLDTGCSEGYETLRTSEQFSMIVSSLKPGIVTLIKDMNGNHVAQCCLQNLMPEYREFLFEAAITNCVELATDRHGCCVLQKCLGHSAVEQRDRIIYEITSNALILSQDPFGYLFSFKILLCYLIERLLMCLRSCVIVSISLPVWVFGCTVYTSITLRHGLM
ncbi:Pumilio-like 12 [Vitis vinifera]|uniref:Pumilio-like 12 n=1 Tax=Vitis vinifera TaxID=29760 RepID=A0A438EM63_VITVI|nr:Pumilio-like 12 [Vitis vinifera]